MQPTTLVVGRAAPLDRGDVDTDAIIPAIWMKRIERTGYADGLFFEWRKDPSFVLNRPEYQGAGILLAGPNFGCGSSREHAPWALRDGGFRAIVSSKFADIFRNNCLKIGLLPVVLPAATVEKLMRAVEADPSLEISIDVVHRSLSAPDADIHVSFELDGFSRFRLIEGLDDIAHTLRADDAITAYEQTRPAWLPVTTRR